MSDRNINANPLIGGLSLVTLIFITLKLCNVIAWPWWWILAPTLIPLLAVIIVLIASLIASR